MVRIDGSQQWKFKEVTGKTVGNSLSLTFAFIFYIAFSNSHLLFCKFISVFIWLLSINIQTNFDELPGGKINYQEWMRRDRSQRGKLFT